MPYAALSPLAEFFRTLSIPVVILDLETTGGHFYADRITELAFLHFWQGKITAVQQLVQPNMPISGFVRDLTGISDEMLQGQPTFAQFAPQVLPLLRGSLLIAHNSRFDYTFLRHECRRNGFTFATAGLCSVQLSRKLYPEFFKHNLDSIIERHGLAVASRHRAMSDVLAVAEYLQLALREKGAPLLGQLMRQLANPPMLPANLPAGVFQAASALPDEHGVSVWRNAADDVVAVHTHVQAYREVAAMLRRGGGAVAQAARLEFVPTLGVLHSVAVKGSVFYRNRLAPTDGIVRHTIKAEQVSGCLKTRVRPLKAGFLTEPPHGLFANPKAAKRALAAWAKKFGLCPALLGILSDELPKGAPCPVSLLGKCSAACETGDLNAHNRAVAAALPFLPLTDWGRTPRVKVAERDELSGREAAWLCDSGAVWLPEPDNVWFCDKEVLAVMKGKFKAQKGGGEIQAA